MAESLMFGNKSSIVSPLHRIVTYQRRFAKICLSHKNEMAWFKISTISTSDNTLAGAANGVFGKD